MAKNEPVKLSGKVNVNKGSEGRKFLKLFFTGSFKDALKYAFDNVFVPYTKDAICRTSTNVVNYWVNGDKPATNTQAGANRVSYWNGAGTRNVVQAAQPAAKPANTIFNVGDLRFENRGDAEAVLMRLKECIDVYHIATVGDLYDLADVKSSHVDFNYGWTDLSTARIIRNIDGTYSIELPRVMPLK